MSELDDIFDIYSSFKMTDEQEFKSKIKDLFLEIIGEDELPATSRPIEDELARKEHNILRVKLRNKVNEL